MRTWTTPTHTFTTDIDLTSAEEIYITYSQGGVKVIEKTKEDLDEITDKQITLTLSQADTGRFRQNEGVEMQIRARFGDGSAFKSNTMVDETDEALKTGVI